MKKKIVIFTDAWYPQVNGVVTTYSNLVQHIDHNLYDVDVVEPSMFSTFNIPFYKEIQLSWCTQNRMREIIKDLGVVYRYHIATEGPIGYAAKTVLDSMGIGYTTAYHTKFPEYLERMMLIPHKLTKRYIDHFHKKSRFVFVPSKSVAEENSHWNTKIIGKGVGEQFTPRQNEKLYNKDSKVLLYVGRVSSEKNVEDFCRIYIPGTHKIVVGNGPDKKRLKRKYPDVNFVGYKFGHELAQFYRSADVFIFPSKTDTFGNVILEAMACGTPVAAYDVTGPRDQITNGLNGYMGMSLTNAVNKCFALDRNKVYNSVTHLTWKNAANNFIEDIS
jgi:glycosyltransferase involved in cell wall biosynthesis